MKIFGKLFLIILVTIFIVLPLVAAAENKSAISEVYAGTYSAANKIDSFYLKNVNISAGKKWVGTCQNLRSFSFTQSNSTKILQSIDTQIIVFEVGFQTGIDEICWGELKAGFYSNLTVIIRHFMRIKYRYTNKTFEEYDTALPCLYRIYEF